MACTSSKTRDAHPVALAVLVIVAAAAGCVGASATTHGSATPTTPSASSDPILLAYTTLASQIPSQNTSTSYMSTGTLTVPDDPPRVGVQRFRAFFTWSTAPGVALSVLLEYNAIQRPPYRSSGWGVLASYAGGDGAARFNAEGAPLAVMAGEGLNFTMRADLSDDTLLNAEQPYWVLDVTVASSADASRNTHTVVLSPTPPQNVSSTVEVNEFVGCDDWPLEGQLGLSSLVLRVDGSRTMMRPFALSEQLNASLCSLVGKQTAEDSIDFHWTRAV